jgi:DNA polymerase (family X)
VKDIDIVIATDQPETVMEEFVNLPIVAAVTVRGETKTSVRLASGIAADVRCVTDEEFPAALVYFTGSKEHNVALRGRAIRKGFGLNEYGLYRDGDFANPESRVPCPDEASVYRLLELSYIEPELREGKGEIEAAEAGALPELVRLTDIRGLLHQHTNWSDGRNTMEEMVQAAIGLGLEYYGITDHSVSAGYAGGLSIERVRQQHAVIDRLNEELEGRIVLLKGIESDILKDGSLDYPDEILETFDYVVGSLHTFFGLDEAEQTERLVRAVSGKHIRILGHPTARLLLRRDPCVFNMRAVLDAATANDVAVEINANPRRLDIDWRECRAARDRGCRFSVNPDAHDIMELRNTRFGVDMARKGWLTPADVINTMSIVEVRRFLGRERLG